MNSVTARCTAAFFLAAWLAVTPRVCAHKLSDSYLTLTLAGGHLTGRWSIALRDLECAVGLDANDDGFITWGELRRQRPAVAEYALSRLALRWNGVEARFRVTSLLVDQLSDGAYAVLDLEFDDPPPRLQTIGVHYCALFDLDPTHRGWVRLEDGPQIQTAVFSPNRPTQRFTRAAPRPWRQLFSFVQVGVWHIWLGFDHILFLLALLLPAVLEERRRRWTAVRAFGPAFANVARVVTAFTAAHSCTLTLAALGWMRLPSRFVESAIAASIVLAAANNLVPFLRARGWVIAFAFGLVHGFGFASALADFGLHRAGLALALVGFNSGVEIGQLCVVALFLPAAFALRNQRLYHWVVFRIGSAAVVLVAGVWFAERLLDFKWLPF